MLNVNSFSFNNYLSGQKSSSLNGRKAVLTNEDAKKDQTLNAENSAKKKNPDKLSIFYCNDIHGSSDQISGLVNAAKNFWQNAPKKDASTMILSAGDNCSGADISKNKFIFDLLQNSMKVEYSAVGNHEADSASMGFSETVKDKNIKFIATNVEFDDNNPMKDVVKKSQIVEKDGVKYGIIGTMPIDFESVTKKEVQEGIDVEDYDDTIECLQEEIDKLKKQGVNRIILLSHTGYDIDKELAKNLDGVDIIVGGHSHSVVEGVKEGDNFLKSKSNEPVVITQAGENAKYFGILDVEFDNNGVIKNVSNTLTETNNQKKSPVIEYIKSKEMGDSPKVGTIKEIDPMPANRRIEPCAWTCMMADSMKEELGGDIALINSANIRKVPMQGTLSERDVSESAPMKNNLIRAKITQKQLVEAVGNAAKSTMQASDGYPGLLQGSGFSYKIDDSGNLLEMNIVDKEGNKTPIDIKNPSENITYNAIYDTFTAQADGETPELAPKFGFEEFQFDKDKTMMDYISKLPDKDNLKVVSDNRIEIQKTSQPKQQGNNTRKFLDLTTPKAS